MSKLRDAQDGDAAGVSFRLMEVSRILSQCPALYAESEGGDIKRVEHMCVEIPPGSFATAVSPAY